MTISAASGLARPAVAVPPHVAISVAITRPVPASLSALSIVPNSRKKNRRGSANAFNSTSLIVNFDGERHLGVEFRYQILPDRSLYSAILDLDNFGLLFHLLAQLLSQRNLFFERSRKIPLSFTFPTDNPGYRSGRGLSFGSSADSRLSRQ